MKVTIPIYYHTDETLNLKRLGIHQKISLHGMLFLKKLKEYKKKQIVDACYEGMQAQGFDSNKGRCKLYYDNKYGK